MTATPVALDLSAAIVAQSANDHSVETSGNEGSGAKYSPKPFINLHLNALQQEGAIPEGCSVTTPRSGEPQRPNSRPSSSPSNSEHWSITTRSPRGSTLVPNSNAGTSPTCTECDNADHTSGSCSWRCVLKSKMRGKSDSEDSSPRSRSNSVEFAEDDSS